LKKRSLRRIAGSRRIIVGLVFVLILSSRAFAEPLTVPPDSLSARPGQDVGLPALGFKQSDSDDSKMDRGKDKGCKIASASLLVSGILLCSWGITSWEIEEYQCCPARNTGNVVKIVAGVLLINAGLLYFLTGCD